MCVWQSQAPPGTLKLTGVAGCAASANTVVSLRSYRKAANPPPISSRRPAFLPNPRLDFVIRGHLGRYRRRICCPILIGTGEAFQTEPLLCRGGGSEGRMNNPARITGNSKTNQVSTINFRLPTTRPRPGLSLDHFP